MKANENFTVLCSIKYGQCFSAPRIKNILVIFTSHEKKKQVNENQM